MLSSLTSFQLYIDRTRSLSNAIDVFLRPSLIADRDVPNDDVINQPIRVAER